MEANKLSLEDFKVTINNICSTLNKNDEIFEFECYNDSILTYDCIIQTTEDTKTFFTISIIADDSFYKKESLFDILNKKRVGFLSFKESLFDGDDNTPYMYRYFTYSPVLDSKAAFN